MLNRSLASAMAPMPSSSEQICTGSIRDQHMCAQHCHKHNELKDRQALHQLLSRYQQGASISTRNHKFMNSIAAKRHCSIHASTVERKTAPIAKCNPPGTSKGVSKGAPKAGMSQKQPTHYEI